MAFSFGNYGARRANRGFTVMALTGGMMMAAMACTPEVPEATDDPSGDLVSTTEPNRSSTTTNGSDDATDAQDEGEPQPSSSTTTGPDGANPARPSPTGDGGSDPNPAWLGRGDMSETAIELPWSTGQVAAEVTIHRFLAADGIDALAVELTDASRVSSGTDSPFVDRQLESGQQYVYVLEATTANGETYRRFTEAHAVTDTTPPEPVGNLNAVDNGDSISLEWGRSSDNYQFGRYAIRRGVNDEQSVYYGTGWTIDQTAFVDDSPPGAGSVTYEVFAIDFHGNLSDVRTATIQR